MAAYFGGEYGNIQFYTGPNLFKARYVYLLGREMGSFFGFLFLALRIISKWL